MIKKQNEKKKMHTSLCQVILLHNIPLSWVSCSSAILFCPQGRKHHEQNLMLCPSQEWLHIRHEIAQTFMPGKNMKERTCTAC